MQISHRDRSIAARMGPLGKRAPKRQIVTLLTLLVFVLAPVILPAQQTLADADWFERDLGSGVTWRHYLFDNLFGSYQSVSYIDVDLDNPNVTVKIPYLAASRQRISSMIPAQFPGAVAGINGTYFETSGSGGHKTYLRVNNVVIPPGGALFSPWGYEGALALDALDNASIESIPPTGWAADTTHPDIIACGPLLIVDGTIPSAYLTSIGAHCTARHPRSAIGITTDNHLILLTADGRTDLAAGMTCEELAQVMDQLGCPDAFNLDGGGSTTLWGSGEPYNGVLNYPSDNGLYDHAGERSCSNAVAVESTAVGPLAWDGRLLSKSFVRLMDTAAQQTVTLVYANIGTQSWTAADTRLVLARPDTRTSPFFDSTTWISASQPAIMTPPTVAPGETATFSFVLQAPMVASTTAYDEHFMLTQSGVGRIGPADSEAWMRLIVQPEVPTATTFIVESRPGGKNYGWYSDVGMADSGANCTAPDCTGTIGTRYGSTYRSVAGSKSATTSPKFPEWADYKVYVAWGDGGSRRSPITYHVNHTKGTSTFQIDQTLTANEWVQLGTGAFSFAQGYGNSVVMTNENIDVSGSMYAGAVKFEYQAPVPPDKTYLVKYLNPAATKPVVDGQVTAGEWDTASTTGTGYVQHDNPSLLAAEDAAFRMLFDDTFLYILLQMNNAYLAGYATPPPGYGYYHLLGDRVNFFLTPYGTSTEPFYRILLSPNPSNGVCYMWSQASLLKTTDATVGTSWIAGGNAAYTHTGGVLTIEYRVPWAEFDFAGIDFSGGPTSGDVWGVQPCITNELTAGVWESVNWEPDTTPSYVFGVPFGGLEFETDSSAVSGWGLY